MVRVVLAAGHSTSCFVSKLSLASAASSGSAPQTCTCGSGQLHRSGDTAQQAAAADRCQHQIDVGQLLDDLQPARALSGDDLRRIVGRDHGVAELLHQLLGLLLALDRRWTDQHNLRAQRRCCITLHLRRVLRHHDDRLRAQRARGIGDALCVVAARVRHDAATAEPQAIAAPPCCTRRAA